MKLKKSLSIVLCIVLLMSISVGLTACGDDKTLSSTESYDETSSELEAISDDVSSEEESQAIETQSEGQTSSTAVSSTAATQPSSKATQPSSKATQPSSKSSVSSTLSSVTSSNNVKSETPTSAIPKYKTGIYGIFGNQLSYVLSYNEQNPSIKIKSYKYTSITVNGTPVKYYQFSTEQETTSFLQAESDEWYDNKDHLLNQFKYSPFSVVFILWSVSTATEGDTSVKVKIDMNYTVTLADGTVKNETRTLYEDVSGYGGLRLYEDELKKYFG